MSIRARFESWKKLTIASKGEIGKSCRCYQNCLPALESILQGSIVQNLSIGPINTLNGLSLYSCRWRWNPGFLFILKRMQVTCQSLLIATFTSLWIIFRSTTSVAEKTSCRSTAQRPPKHFDNVNYEVVIVSEMIVLVVFPQWSVNWVSSCIWLSCLSTYSWSKAEIRFLKALILLSFTQSSSASHRNLHNKSLCSD